ncbi:hypothetical protein NPIL_17641 [Nephila pilipes]|uniref:Uncharacterized protein n=1 Tax=Nephila pilipes TaxID=299642 RepID=A0A8X6Q2A6_NEPPI|nr:hypothetical protein NPIL_17641 [Nephila pilipes]
MESYLKTATSEDGSIYKLASRSNKKENKVIPPLLGPTGLQYSPKDKSNLIANSLQKQFINNRTPCNDFHTDRVISCVQDFFSQPPDHYIPPLTSPQEIQEIILKLKNRKAPGNQKLQYFLFYLMLFIQQTLQLSYGEEVPGLELVIKNIYIPGWIAWMAK